MQLRSLRVPFTQVRIQTWVILLLILLVTFDRRLAAVLVIFYFGAWAMLLLVYGLAVFLADGKSRRPGEPFRAFFARVQAETREANRYNDARSPWDQTDDEIQHRRGYFYVHLTCGHTVFDCFPQQAPVPGEEFYCPKHRRFGPAQSSTVQAVTVLPDPQGI